VVRGGYRSLVEDFIGPDQPIFPVDLARMSPVWREAAAGYFLMHHWHQGLLLHLGAYEEMTILADEFGFDPPQVGASWFLPHEPEAQVLMRLDDVVRNRTDWVETGFCWLYHPAAMLRDRSGDPAKAGMCGARPNPFNLPSEFARDTAFEGRELARFLPRLNQIKAPDPSGGLVYDDRERLRISELFDWREILFSHEDASHFIGRDIRAIVREELSDPVRRMDWAFLFRQPLCLRRSSYASSMEGVYGLIFDALGYQGQLPGSPQEAAAHLRAMWWVLPRPLIDCGFRIDLIDSCGFAHEVAQLAELANGDGTSVYGKPVRIDIQFVIRS